MELQIESQNLEDYLRELPPVIQFHTPAIAAKIEYIKSHASSDRNRAKMAFEVARDEVVLSYNSQEERITINAEDVL